jgi:cytoskeletal protein CcmA (bactofilin family)
MEFKSNAYSAREMNEDDSSYGGGPGKSLLNITGDKAKIEGKIIISNSIEIDCEVHGELVIDGQMLIQENGYVNAEVKTIDAKITGIYEGNMEASGNVQITETGKVNGNIKTDSLIIEKGGIFSGNVTRITEEGQAPSKKEYAYGYGQKTATATEEEIGTEDEGQEEDNLSL